MSCKWDDCQLQAALFSKYCHAHELEFCANRISTLQAERDEAIRERDEERKIVDWYASPISWMPDGSIIDDYGKAFICDSGPFMVGGRRARERVKMRDVK